MCVFVFSCPVENDASSQTANQTNADKISDHVTSDKNHKTLTSIVSRMKNIGVLFPTKSQLPSSV